MKRFMGIVLLVVLQLGAAAGWLAYGSQKHASGEAGEWANAVTLTPEERQLQENLAMWYNLNLTNSGEGKPAEGYESILYLDNGLMCTVDFLKDGVVLPVWHGARNAQNLGFTHEQRSSLPVGGSGNHTVLYGKADVLDEITFPQRGDRICVHALGSSLTYRIFDVKTTKRDPALPEFEPERDLCSIRIRTDNGWVMIRGVRVKESER